MAEQWMTFGEWMMNEANRLGHTQQEIADYAGVKSSYISDIKRGNRAASKRIIDAVAEMFDADRDMLYAMCGYCPPSLVSAPAHLFKQAMKVVKSQ